MLPITMSKILVLICNSSFVVEYVFQYCALSIWINLNIANVFSAIIFGALAIGLSYLAPLLGETVVQITPTVYGAIGGPLFSLFFLGFYVPWSNKWVSYHLMYYTAIEC